MVKLLQCERCLLCAHEPLIVCAVHPAGPTGDTCLDFRLNPDLEGRKFVDFLGLQRRQNREEITNDEPFSNPLDLEPDEDLWEPEGVSYYAGELILQPQQRWTQEEQLTLVDTHPLFTGKCPACNRQFPQYEKPLVHWDCLCGWIDDTV